MVDEKTKKMILDGEAVLGIELGSTRIKAVLVNRENEPIAQGGSDWENTLLDGYWTYSLSDVWKNLATCFSNLKKDVQEKFGIPLTKTKALGISAMMHGYLAFDKGGTCWSLSEPGGTQQHTRLQRSFRIFLTTRFLSAGPSHTSTRQSSTRKSMSRI